MSSELARHNKQVRIAPKVLLANEGVAPLPAARPVEEEKPPLQVGLLPLLPIQSFEEEEIQPGEDLAHLKRPSRVESPPLEEWPSPCAQLKEELSNSWEDSSCSPTPKPKKSSYCGLKSQKCCSSLPTHLEVPILSANRSLREGLVLDTMNDSLSKILLDISFPGLEEDPLGPDNINWSQFIPELQ
ncbi:forkhead box protein M1-like isoform 2 [Cricetulus griseus]|uniref:Forkhead box protein M1-like isoform 2 n=1 Tax=Cricetulus griseus TaxID=10029 RepID=A0A061IIG0_CRIGR|nr:forkhead box protein M1-like isoform 2 [Cricetulus griseus]